MGERKILGEEGGPIQWIEHASQERERKRGGGGDVRRRGTETVEEVRCRWDESLNWAALTNDSNGSWPEKPWGTSHIARAHASPSLSVVPPSLFLLFSFRYSRLRTRPRMTRSSRIKNSIARTNSDSRNFRYFPFRAIFFFSFFFFCARVWDLGLTFLETVV